MAANSQSRGLASMGKRLVGQIRSRDSLSLRSVHISAYDKNHEEIVQPNVVPDHVIPPHNEKYWAPHPQTGVFGPTTDGKFDVHATATSEDSVLEQKTFIRPLEDLDKPPVQP